MAFTKVVGAGIHTLSNITSHNINSSGIITATKFVGPITGGGGDFNAGIVTATGLDVNGNADISGDLVLGGNLTVNGDFTTLNTTLREVELLKVDANSSTTAGIITQRGSGDILNLFDGNTEVLTVIDGGKVGIGTDNPFYTTSLDVFDSSSGTDEDLFSVRSKTGAFLIQCSDKNAANPEWRLRTFASEDLVFSPGGTGAAGEKVRITSAGDVGIGTDDPSQLLDVGGNTTVASNGRVNIHRPTSGSTNTAFQINSDVGGTDTTQFIIQAGGVALFGGLTSQTADTSKLAVQGGDSNIGIIQVHAGGGENSGDLSGIAFSHGTDNATARAKCAIASRATGAYGRGDLCFYVDGASDNNQVSAADEKLRIDSSGRLIVGGGTHAGGSALVVKGGNQNTYSTIGMFSNHTNPSNNTLLAQIRLGSNTTAVGANIRATAAGAWGTNDYPTRLDFYTTPDSSNNAQQRLRIGHTGIIGINNNGSRTLHVQTSSDHGNIGVFAGENINSSNNATMFFLSTYRDENSGEYFMQFNKDQDNNGGGVQAVYRVNTRGDVQNKYNSYSSTSDVKLKENIVDANSQWDDIKAIKVRNFNFKTDPGTKLLGVVAQEIENVSAGLVEDTPDKDITKEGDEGTTTKSVKYSILYMKAIKCLQEAQARIEQLEAKVATLEGS